MYSPQIQHSEAHCRSICPLLHRSRLRKRNWAIGQLNSTSALPGHIFRQPSGTVRRSTTTSTSTPIVLMLGLCLAQLVILSCRSSPKKSRSYMYLPISQRQVLSSQRMWSSLWLPHYCARSPSSLLFLRFARSSLNRRRWVRL